MRTGAAAAAKEAPVEEQEEPQTYLVLLGQQIKLHWEKYRPAMYRQLEQSGQLHQATLQAREQTSDALHHTC